MSGGSRLPTPKDVFDAVERPLGTALERLVQTPGFSDLVRRSVTVRAATRRRAERVSRRFWHALNLPTGSDVRRLEAQVSRLERTLEAARRDDTTRREPRQVLP